jgi:hypothetical protein
MRTSTLRVLLPLTAIGLVSPQMAQAAPLCVFNDGSYSEGARICAEPGLMLGCNVNGDRAVWSVVTETGGVCASSYSSSSRRGSGRMMRHRMARRAPPDSSETPSPDGAKCFTFNGKRFCE